MISGQLNVNPVEPWELTDAAKWPEPLPHHRLDPPGEVDELMSEIIRSCSRGTVTEPVMTELERTHQQWLNDLRFMTRAGLSVNVPQDISLIGGV